MISQSLKLIILCLLVYISNAEARYYQKNSAVIIPKPTQTSLIVDAKTGRILHHRNARVKIFPASLTKIMTLYMTFEAVETGKLVIGQKLLVSANAERMRPSKLHLRAGQRITVRDAILGLIIKSANDSAVVLAENIAGSEANFARLMTMRARQLGMRNTIFKNASGWHHPKQKTTAADLAKLSIAIRRDHPKLYRLFLQKSFMFRGKLILSRNRVSVSYRGAEGLKTGYTRRAGFNLITVASRNNRSLVGVVTGSKTADSRDQQMVQLLNHHFQPLVIKSKNKLLVVKHTAQRRQFKKLIKSRRGRS